MRCINAASREKAPTSHMAGTVSLHRRLKELERQREREALQRIERLLPAAFTSSAQQNSAGKRSVGAFGRSQINILSDLVRYVSSVKHRGVVSDASVREALLSGQNLLVLEVDPAPGLTVRAASAGASEFFKHSPYGSSLVGRSIASLLHESIASLLHAGACAPVSRSNSARTSRLGRFMGIIRLCCAWSLPLSPVSPSSCMTVTTVSWPEAAGTWALWP